MLKFVVLLCAVSYATAAALPKGLLPQLDGRIVGGESTTISAFPWQVSHQHSGSHSCGGSIYNSQIIVTAAHCLEHVPSASVLKIRAGSTYWSSGGVLINVAAFKINQAYNTFTMANDIAIIRLSSALNMSSTIESISLVSTAPANGAAAAVSGWGTTISGGSMPAELRYAELTILDRSKCSSSTYGYGSKIAPSMICAHSAGKDSCKGDSGGPLVSGGQLVGVVSWGYSCASPKYPGVFADVAALRSWVINTASTV